MAYEYSCEISGSHGGEYENDSFLGYGAVFSRGSRPTVQRCVLPTIVRIVEAVRISETSVYFHESTRRHIPEGCHSHEY
jgi:hypothetical protein